jgi:predicted nucleic acid-binding protein
MEIKNEIIIDSCVWIAFFIENDSLHEKSLLLEADILKTKYIPDFVFFEVCTVLRKKGGLSFCKIFIEYIEKNTDIQIISLVSDLQSFSNFFLSEKYNKLSFIDSTLVYLNIKDNCKIVTFDKEILKFLK